MKEKILKITFDWYKKWPEEKMLATKTQRHKENILLSLCLAKAKKLRFKESKTLG